MTKDLENGLDEKNYVEFFRYTRFAQQYISPITKGALLSKLLSFLKNQLTKPWNRLFNKRVYNTHLILFAEFSECGKNIW